MKKQNKNSGVFKTLLKIYGGCLCEDSGFGSLLFSLQSSIIDIYRVLNTLLFQIFFHGNLWSPVSLPPKKCLPLPQAPSPNLLKRKVFLQSQLWSIQLERSNMSTRAQNKGKIKEHARNLLKFFYQVGKKNMWIYMGQSIQEWTK